MKTNRVLLKLSGEALAGPKKTGFDEDTVREVARQVKISVDQGVQVGIVIGGGNFWRGRTSSAIDRTKADQIGMLATVMNCIYVSEIFRAEGMKTQIFTPFLCGSMTELFSKDKANRCFEEGTVVFFAGGTGHPYFSTDTGIVLRAIEMDADCILLAKSIDGVYDSDPKLNPDAKRYDTISIQEVIDKKLAVVDLTASIMCMEHRMPMAVFDLNEKDSIANAMTALSGAVLAQYQKSADINLGTGMVVIGLASLIIGETLFGRGGLWTKAVAAVAGSVIYRFIIALALRANVPSESLKLISAVIVALAIAAPALRDRAAFRRRRAHAEKEGARHA